MRVLIEGLTVVDRPSKPRQRGLSWCLDDGLPVRFFYDLLESFHDLIDGVKFGWGTALVQNDVIQSKISICRQFQVDYCFGGTLFEAYYAQHQLDAFFRLIDIHQCPVVEISDGTISLSVDERRRAIKEAARYARVFTEVGSKDPDASALWDVDQWVRSISRDLEGGAERVILEARESGTSGICLPNGAVRADVVQGLLADSIPLAHLIMEAPQKSQQVYWIQLLGPSINLSNIAVAAIVNLETLRLGLRSDTLKTSILMS